MSKIEMKTPIVEIDGDEMTRVLWPMVKEKLLTPHIDLKTLYFDLSLTMREATKDQITVAAANAIIHYGVGVKCATITPNADRVKEYGLTRQWKSPNGTIRAILGGTVFRKPIIVKNIQPAVRSWKKPIIVGRHAYGDVYKNSEIRVDGPGTTEIVFTAKDGSQTRETIADFDGPGIIQGIHNTDESISDFARACFSFALDQKVDVWFATKDTISKTYDQHFKEIFSEIFAAEFKERFQQAGISYFYTLIDDVVARMMKTEGGMLWACKNYDGDVMSDLVASAFGSLAMMTSVLVSPKGYFEFEAAHGTVQRHYYKHLKGEKTSTNSIALIFAWTGALRKRGQMDGVPRLVEFADLLEAVVKETIEDGYMTGDLARISEPAAKAVLHSEDFLDEVAKRFDEKWQ